MKTKSIISVSSDGLSVKWNSGPQLAPVCSLFSVDSGICYYEVSLLTSGPIQIGWATNESELKVNNPNCDLYSIAFDGFNREIVHRNNVHKLTEQKSVTSRWKVGDVVGCLIDCKEKRFVFYLNGSEIECDFAVHFSNQPYRAYAMLSVNQQCHFNFGQNSFGFAPENIATDKLVSQKCVKNGKLIEPTLTRQWFWFKSRRDFGEENLFFVKDAEQSKFDNWVKKLENVLRTNCRDLSQNAILNREFSELTQGQMSTLRMIQSMIEILEIDDMDGNLFGVVLPALEQYFIRNSFRLQNTSQLLQLLYPHLKIDSSNYVRERRRHKMILFVLYYFTSNAYSSLFIDEVVNYLIDILECDQDGWDILFAILCLENYAINYQNKLKLMDNEKLKRRLKALFQNEQPMRYECCDWSNVLKYQVGFCARACSDSFVSSDRSHEMTTTKFSPDRMSFRNDFFYFQTVQSPVSVTSSTYYYEAILLTSGSMRIGWSTAQSDCSPWMMVGDAVHSIAFDTTELAIYHERNKIIATNMHDSIKPGDVVGCLLDCSEQQYSFFLNGVNLELKNRNFGFDDPPYYATISLSTHQQISLNFGQAPFFYVPKYGNFLDFHYSTGGDFQKYRLVKFEQCPKYDLITENNQINWKPINLLSQPANKVLKHLNSQRWIFDQSLSHKEVKHKSITNDNNNIIRFAHKWIIENYSKLVYFADKTSGPITSSQFSSPLIGEIHKFYLKLNPPDNSVSLHFNSKCAHSVTKVRWTISMLNDEGKKIETTETLWSYVREGDLIECQMKPIEKNAMDQLVLYSEIEMIELELDSLWPDYHCEQILMQYCSNSTLPVCVLYIFYHITVKAIQKLNIVLRRPLEFRSFLLNMFSKPNKKANAWKTFNSMGDFTIFPVSKIMDILKRMNQKPNKSRTFMEQYLQDCNAAAFELTDEKLSKYYKFADKCVHFIQYNVFSANILYHDSSQIDQFEMSLPEMKAKLNLDYRYESVLDKLEEIIDREDILAGAKCNEKEKVKRVSVKDKIISNWNIGSLVDYNEKGEATFSECHNEHELKFKLEMNIKHVETDFLPMVTLKSNFTFENVTNLFVHYRITLSDWTGKEIISKEHEALVSSAIHRAEHTFCEINLPKLEAIECEIIDWIPLDSLKNKTHLDNVLLLEDFSVPWKIRNASQNVDKSCSITEFRKYSLHWTVDKMKFFQPSQLLIESPTFQSSITQQQHKFTLRFFPKFESLDKKYYVDLLVKSHDNLDAIVEYVFSIQNCEGNVLLIKEGKQQVTGGVSNENLVDFPLQILADSDSKLFRENNFVIHCEIIVLEPAHEVKLPRICIKNELTHVLCPSQPTDVTFEFTNGKCLYAHKDVLRLASRVFKAMLSHDMLESTQNRVQLVDVEWRVFEDLLRYLYTGEAYFLHDLAQELLIVADKYMVLELKQLCEQHLCSQLSSELQSIETLQELNQLSQFYNAETLKNQTRQYIQSRSIEMGLVIDKH